jgi:aldehyde dehydrogenase (NAD+)
VVLDDADMGAAAGLSGIMALTHAGQGCAISTRLVVPRARYDEAVDIASATMSGMGAGDPTDPGIFCGPLISARQRDRVERYLATVPAEGGSFACGGGRTAGFDRGYFIDPTVVVGLDNDATVAREEIFGPVLTVIPHDGDDDAVAIANDSPYGLSGAVYSGDSERAWAAAQRIRTGTMSVNGGLWYSADVPFGGYKQSGIGREMGVAGFEEYLETKVIAEGV